MMPLSKSSFSLLTANLSNLQGPPDLQTHTLPALSGFITLWFQLTCCITSNRIPCSYLTLPLFHVDAFVIKAAFQLSLCFPCKSSFCLLKSKATVPVFIADVTNCHKPRSKFTPSSSGGQESEIGFVGLKVRFQEDCIPSGVSSDNVASCLVHFPRATCIPSYMSLPPPSSKKYSIFKLGPLG